MKQIKLISLLAGLLLCTNLWAATEVSSWDSGDCTVKLYDDGVLTISKKSGDGNGATADYSSSTSSTRAPWYGNNSITSIVVGEGVRVLGEYVLYELRKVTTISLPSTLVSIKKDAFGYCQGITSITIPENVSYLGQSAFYRCNALLEVFLQSATPASLPGAPNTGSVFKDCPSDLILKYPNGAESTTALESAVSI